MGMGKTYLVNAFSINMLGKFPTKVVIDSISQEEFCSKLEDSFEEESFTNAIGHYGTVYLINKICGTIITKNRIDVKLQKGDVALVAMLNYRLEEGKVLLEEEIMEMLKEGKISFYEVEVR